MDNTRREFGDVFAGEELEHVFIIRNAGGAPLELAEKSVTTGSRLPASSGLIRAVGSPLRRDLLLVRAAAGRAAPS